jgi:hypothetical protein
MNPDQPQHNPGPQEGKLPPAETGNASNPTPHDTDKEPVGTSQLIDKMGEKYLREGAAPEDYPDPQDQQDAEKAMKPGN